MFDERRVSLVLAYRVLSNHVPCRCKVMNEWVSFRIDTKVLHLSLHGSCATIRQLGQHRRHITSPNNTHTNPPTPHFPHAINSSSASPNTQQKNLCIARLFFFRGNRPRLFPSLLGGCLANGMEWNWMVRNVTREYSHVCQVPMPGVSSWLHCPLLPLRKYWEMVGKRRRIGMERMSAVVLCCFIARRGVARGKGGSLFFYPHPSTLQDTPKSEPLPFSVPRVVTCASLCLAVPLTLYQPGTPDIPKRISGLYPWSCSTLVSDPRPSLDHAGLSLGTPHGVILLTYSTPFLFYPLLGNPLQLTHHLTSPLSSFVPNFNQSIIHHLTSSSQNKKKESTYPYTELGRSGRLPPTSSLRFARNLKTQNS